MQVLKIITLCITAAVLYGIVHDQVTARVCLEYFTVAHPTIIRSTSPTMLALAWGVVATWWMGLILGVLIAMCCRAGRWPKLEARQLIRPLAVVVAIMAVFALFAGLAAARLSAHNDWYLTGRYATRVLPEHHRAFFAVASAHWASYVGGGICGLGLCVSSLRQRFRVRGTPIPGG